MERSGNEQENEFFSSPGLRKKEKERKKELKN
jgi:hypothetical protein